MFLRLWLSLLMTSQSYLAKPHHIPTFLLLSVPGLWLMIQWDSSFFSLAWNKCFINRSLFRLPAPILIWFSLSLFFFYLFPGIFMTLPSLTLEFLQNDISFYISNNITFVQYGTFKRKGLSWILFWQGNNVYEGCWFCVGIKVCLVYSSI